MIVNMRDKAKDLYYSNVKSGLKATNSQDAIDEVSDKVDQIAGNQIPEEYLEAAVDNYVNNNSAGFATKVELEGLDSQLSSEIATKVIQAEKDYKNKFDNTKNSQGKLQINGLNTGVSNWVVSDWVELKSGNHYVFYAYNNESLIPLQSSIIILTSTTKADFYSDTSNNALYADIHTLTPTRDLYARMSVYSSVSVKIMCLQVENETSNIPEYVEYGEDGYKNHIKDYNFATLDDLNGNSYVSIFNTIMCVGDSITEGYRKQGFMDKTRSYPSFLQRIFNNEVINGGISGATPKDWYEMRIGGDYRPFTFGTYDACIVNLGQNAGLTDTLDVDVNPYTNPEDFADTQTGWYCRIIEHIKSQNATIAIFLCKGQKDTTTNIVIDKIANKYNLPVIDYTAINPKLADGTNRHVSRNGESYGVHYNTLGYFELALAIAKGMNDYIKNNLVKFLEVMQ